MLNITCILARSGEDELMKIVFGVAAVVVWGLFQLIGAIAKKAEDAKRRQRYGRLPADVARRGGMPPLPTIPTPPIPGQRKQNKAKSAKKRAPVMAASPPVGQAVREIASGVQEVAASRAQVRRAAASVAPAGQIARLLRRPESLRAAVIMNEVMSKPVALREETRG